jgi:DNA-binding NtrC family response regulator
MTIILTVEDEFLVGAYLGEVLEEAGYQVIAAANADEAIAILESRSDIQIVITDINMPGSMDGLKLAAAVRGRWPPIQIIIASGKGGPRTDEMPQGSHFMPKPYAADRILAAVRQFQ